MDKNLLKAHLNNLKEELDSCRYTINKYSKYNIVEPNKEIINELYNKRLKLSVELNKIKTELDKVNDEIEKYQDNEFKYQNLNFFTKRIPMLEYLISILEEL